MIIAVVLHRKQHKLVPAKQELQKQKAQNLKNIVKEGRILEIKTEK